MPSILNADLIKQRRLELGLSQREVARRVGISAPAILAIEHGTNHHALTLRVVSDLACALAIPADLLLASRDQPPPPADDDVTLEAALLSVRGARPAALLARALGWRRSRLDRAASDLTDRYSGTGAALVRTPRGLQIQPRPGVLKVEMPDSRAARAAGTGRALTTLETRLLVDASEPDGIPRRKIATNATRVAIAHLRRLGYVEETAAGYRASGSVRATFDVARRFTPA
jgi:transcriptional regulator with XRE-family HTH domain